MKLKDSFQIIKGLATNIPQIKTFADKKTGGTATARYCYSVWLRHLIIAKKNKLINPKTKIVSELGPGDSIGTGIAALLTGMDKYYALDLIKYSDTKKNLKILEELVCLFENRSRIPDEKEFPNLKPYLKNYSFPDKILTKSIMKRNLSRKRIEQIRKAIINYEKYDPKNKVSIRYFAPWDGESVIKNNSADMIFSQAVLEHVSNPEKAYKAMYIWLKQGGFISHTIDLKSHGFSEDWNGHWQYSEKIWKIIKGKRPYVINRISYTQHLNLIKKSGFKIIQKIKINKASAIESNQISKDFKHINNTDLNTAGLFIQAIKK
jgi:SAM-dependent methyltransferase